MSIIEQFAPIVAQMDKTYLRLKMEMNKPNFRSVIQSELRNLQAQYLSVKSMPHQNAHVSQAIACQEIRIELLTKILINK